MQSPQGLLLLACFILFTVFPVFANTIRLDQNQFREFFTEDVNISGSVRTGVMYQSSSQFVKPDALFIDIGTKLNQMLCVKMISVDGRYGANFQYEITGKIRGVTRFQLPTQLHEIVTGYTPEQIAVLAEIKPACKGKSKHIVPASWDKPENDSINVFLNSGGSTTYLKLYLLEGGSKKSPCQPIKADRGTAYDKECQITDPQRYELSKTKIIRTNFDSYFKPLKLKIHNTSSWEH